MKKYILFLLASSFFCFAQVPNIKWQKSFGGTEFEVAYSVIATSEGGIVFTGETRSAYGDTGANNNGRFTLWVVKLNAAGAIQWQKPLGGTKNEKGSSVIETSDLGIIVAGYTNSNDNDVTLNKGENDFWVIKFSESGTIEWKKTYGGAGSDETSKIKQTQDGGYVVCGVTNSTDGDITNAKGEQDYWVIKLDSTGNLIWQKTLGGSRIDQTSDLLVTSDGGYIVAGRSISTNGDVTNTEIGYCGWVVKLDQFGTIEWEQCFKNGVTAIQYIPSSNEYILVGYGEGLNGDSWITKINNVGDIVWKKNFGGSNYELTRSVSLTTDGGFLTCGVTYSDDGDVTNYKGNGDFWLVKFDKNGELVWEKTFGGSGGDIPYDMTISSSGEIILAGNTNSTDGDITDVKGNSDIWIVTLERETLENNSFNKDLFSMYPNPVSNFLNLTFSDTNQEKQILIVDMNGKIVINKNQKSNKVNVENLSKGTYNIQVKTNSLRYSSKFIKK